MSLVFAYNQAPQQVAAFFASFTHSAALFLLAVNVFLLISGCLMEGVTLLVLATPLLAPAVMLLPGRSCSNCVRVTRPSPR